MKQKSDLKGLCYVLSEVFFHLHPQFKLKPMQGSYRGVSHWWLIALDGKIVDVTASQFSYRFPYHRGTARGFLTKKPSKRAQAIMKIINERV